MCTLSPEGGAVRCAKGLTVHADHSYSHAPPLDVLVYPASRHAPTASRRVSAALGAAAARHRATDDQRVHRRAGLRRRWATPRAPRHHPMELPRPAPELDPTIDVRAADRFVDDGDVITAAGISAGIDMALHLVARLADTDHARQVRRGIQYDPEPPI